MAANPVRLQAYFPKDVYERLHRESTRLGISMAELVRQAVQEYLQRENETAHPEDPIWQITSLAATYGSSHLHDGAARHDNYIYDADTKEADST